MFKNVCIPIMRHDWSKWSEVISSYGNDKQQYRYCLKCNKIVYRTIGYADGTDASLINKVIQKLKGITNEKNSLK